MMGQLVARGHQLTSHPEEAEVIVVNTCSFIRPAQQESVDTILEMARHKRSGTLKKLIVAGCLVERYGEEIRRRLPEVDAVLGANEVPQIVAACEGRPVTADSRRPYLYNHLSPRVRATPPHYAYIKIAEGCDHSCSFCIIPQLRGPYRSRTIESVVTEAARLFAQGVREINLVSQDTTAYGEDLGRRDGLARLLARLARIETPQPVWIRFLYAHPSKITPRLLETMAAHPALVRYLDVPFQHSSARVLRRMRRGGSGKAFLRLLEKIRRALPGVAIRTSLMVGFPGETPEDFQDLCRFVEAARFDHLGVFSYDDEETCASHRLEGKIPARIVYNRKRRLLAIQRRISRALNRQQVGHAAPVLVEGPSRETDLLWEARTPAQAPEIDSLCLVNDFLGAPPRAGQSRRLRVTAAHDYELIGTLLPDEGETHGEQLA